MVKAYFRSVWYPPLSGHVVVANTTCSGRNRSLTAAGVTDLKVQSAKLGLAGFERTWQQKRSAFLRGATPETKCDQRVCEMTDGNDFTGLNYDLLVEDTLRLVVRSALKITEQSGLIGETHFYISFQTGYPGVEMDDTLRAQHPETITIVIQHQVADLVV